MNDGDSLSAVCHHVYDREVTGIGGLPREVTVCGG